VDWIVREALTSGVDEVVLIVSPRDGDLIRRYFDELPQGTLAGAGGQRILHAWSELKELSKHLRYVYQLEPGGFGHAVLQCREVVGSYPFVLLLGDHLYRSRSTVSCVRQVLDTGVQFGTGVLGVSRCWESQISQRGLVGVRSLPDQSRVFELSDMREKPTVREARASVCIPGSEPPQYFCLFGIYLLPGQFMEYLAAASQQNQGELDLSAALRSWIYRDGGLAYEVDGEFLDIGTPTGFRSTVTRFSQ
jgi:UTP--glucose-1-phosphate uridylyltransferase